jgi:hypothetical protein
VSGDHLYFTSSHNGDMTGFDTETNPLSYAGLHVLDGHTGTITLTVPVSFETLEMRSEEAVIDQPLGEESALTVTARFDWTGGTINESETASTVTLSGSVALIAPQDAGVVRLGSNLNFVSNALATLRAGTVAALNGGLVICVQNAGLAIDPGEGQRGIVSENLAGGLTSPRIDLVGGVGWIEVRSGGFTLAGWMQNPGGRLSLFSGTSLMVGGQHQGSGHAYIQSNQGVTELFGQSILQAGGTRTISIEGGIFKTVAGTGHSSDATVATRIFYFTGGTLMIGAGEVGNGHRFGTFTVLGEAAWDGGEFRPVVEGAMDWGQSDVWEVSGGLDVAGGELNPQSRDGEDNPGPPTSNGHWTVIRSSLITSGQPGVEYDHDTWSLSQIGPPSLIREWVVVAN